MRTSLPTPYFSRLAKRLLVDNVSIHLLLTFMNSSRRAFDGVYNFSSPTLPRVNKTTNLSDFPLSIPTAPSTRLSLHKRATDCYLYKSKTLSLQVAMRGEQAQSASCSSRLSSSSTVLTWYRLCLKRSELPLSWCNQHPRLCLTQNIYGHTPQMSVIVFLPCIPNSVVFRGDMGLVFAVTKSSRISFTLLSQQVFILRAGIIYLVPPY